ncbi:MAG: hypothetical protein M1822_008930 [Bathelium mastoideum]|nr:MAG: hypothetical protein M1822_008930 [Bathelium mastoideum]
MFIEALLCLGVAWLTWSMASMEFHHRRARAIGIPLVRLPVDPTNVLWLIFEAYIWRILNLLPFSLGSFALYSRRGWHFYDKAESHLRYGPVWALVSPGGIYVYVAEPDTVHDIFTRRQDFLRPSKLYKLLEVYGPCISTASWKDWPRHRKVLAAPFNESIMNFVWNESQKQAQEMVTAWTGSSHKSEAVIPSVARDMRTLSLNVLAATGFRRSYTFRSAAQPKQDEASTYRNALQTVLDNAIFLMLVPYRLAVLPFMPKSWIGVGKAASDFKQYMIQMLDEETSALDQGKEGSGGLMTAFVRALHTSEKEDGVDKSSKPTGSTPKGLSVDEIFGNIFVINFAGHDTTANTLAFATLLLAANPSVQEWVGEELEQVLQNRQQSKWDYALLFPKLLRCQAVLLETLRLYPPILALPKWSNDQPQKLRVGEKTLTIPPNTGIMPSLLAIQTHPKYWPKPLVWDPRRWINEKGDLISPRQSTYFPWSDGPQNCPGEKFAQVEFVAVLATLLKSRRIQVLPAEGESVEKAQQRCLEATQDCNLELLLRMKDADTVKLALVQV